MSRLYVTQGKEILFIFIFLWLHIAVTHPLMTSEAFNRTFDGSLAPFGVPVLTYAPMHLCTLVGANSHILACPGAQ